MAIGIEIDMVLNANKYFIPHFYRAFFVHNNVLPQNRRVASEWSKCRVCYLTVAEKSKTLVPSYVKINSHVAHPLSVFSGSIFLSLSPVNGLTVVNMHLCIAQTK
jgi:hypothetical protein